MSGPSAVTAASVSRRLEALTVQFGLTDDQQLFRETTVKFLEDTCPLDAVRRIAKDEPGGFDRDWWRRGAELGWTSMLVSEDHGGGSVSGRPLGDLVLVAEEMGRLVSPGPLIPTNVVAGALSRAGSPAQHKQLAGLLGGETVATWCPDGVSMGGGAVRPTGSAPCPRATASSSTAPPGRWRPAARRTCSW